MTNSTYQPTPFVPDAGFAPVAARRVVVRVASGIARGRSIQAP